jgi:hypothetical protein
LRLRIGFCGNCYFGANVRADAGFLGGHVKARRAIEAVAVGDGDGGQIERGGGFDEVLGQGSGLQEAERGAGVEFYVPQS